VNALNALISDVILSSKYTISENVCLKCAFTFCHIYLNLSNSKHFEISYVWFSIIPEEIKIQGMWTVAICEACCEHNIILKLSSNCLLFTLGCKLMGFITIQLCVLLLSPLLTDLWWNLVMQI
jgi:hypothetical protein